MKNSRKNFFIWAAILFIVFSVFQSLSGPESLIKNKFDFSDFIQKVDNFEVEKVSIKGKDLTGTLKNGEEFLGMDITQSPLGETERMVSFSRSFFSISLFSSS